VGETGKTPAPARVYLHVNREPREGSGQDVGGAGQDVGDAGTTQPRQHHHLFRSTSFATGSGDGGKGVAPAPPHRGASAQPYMGSEAEILESQCPRLILYAN